MVTILPVRRVYCNDKSENIRRINNLSRTKCKDFATTTSTTAALLEKLIVRQFLGGKKNFAF